MPDEPVVDLSGRTLGEFKLREQIGLGGHAVIYRAEQAKLQRDVVVKVLHARPEHYDAARERFLREARVASKLDHPYSTDVYAFGAESDGLLWFAMELVDGVTLDEWLKQHGPMALDVFVPFFEEMTKVVQTMHDLEIVHRDLKPANVMVVMRGGRPYPTLLDFGIAKASGDAVSLRLEPREAPPAPPADDAPAGKDLAPRDERRTRTDPRQYSLTLTGCAMGSAPYMPPEQWDNARHAGPASDIYSLGILAYEALTGRRPFQAESSIEYHRQHLFAEVPPLGGDLPPELDRVIGRALAKKPAARHQSVMELASELRAVLRAHPREQLRSSAQQWKDRARSPALLWGRKALADFERRNRGAPADRLSELECSFVAASQRRARRLTWLRRAFVALAAVAALGVLQLRAVMRADTAEQVATESALEQGRQALLHGESSEAVRHLERAYQRGEQSPGVAFMLARALQPRMAELARFTSTTGRMWSAAFTPDGKRVLTTDDQSARMWDAESGHLLFTMSHGDTVYQAVFSADGSRIITAGGDGSVRIWNAATGAAIRELRYSGSNAKQWRYYSVATSMHFVAAIDLMGRAAHVWDENTGAQLAELDNDALELGLVAFSADGRWLATSGGDEVRVFDTSGWRRTATIPGPRVRSFSFDPTSPRLVVGTYDGGASIWELPSAACVRSLRRAGASVDAVAFSRDGSLVATASRDGTEQVWDAASGALRAQFNSHRSKIYAVEFATTGELLLSAGADGAVVVSNFATGMPVARLEGPKGLIFAAHFDRDARRVVSASWDGTSRVWRASSPYHRWGSPPLGPECDTMDSLIPDQRFVALSCRNHGTRVWDTAQDKLLGDLPEVTPSGDDYYAAFPALTDTADLAAIARGNAVEIYALPSGQLLRTVMHPAPVNAVAFAPAGHDLVSGAIDGSLRITRDGRDVLALPTSTAGIDAAAILRDGRVVVADSRSRLRVIDPERNALLMDIATPSRVRLLRPSPDGTRLVTISTRNKQVPPSLWDLEERRWVASLDGHIGRVFTARFVADGRKILTAGADGTARLWDASTGNPAGVFRGDSHFLADATLSPDGAMVVAGDSDGALRFWDDLNERLLWTLPAHNTYIIGVHYEGDDIVTRGFAGDIARWSLPQPGRIIEACHATACAPMEADQ